MAAATEAEAAARPRSTGPREAAQGGQNAPYHPSATSGRSSATSGRSAIQDLPPIEEADPDIELQEDIKKPVKGWRLEQNSNGYWRWRYLAKGDNGMSQTYRDKAGKIAYKRGSQYVRLGELDAAREEEKRLRADEPI